MLISLIGLALISTALLAFAHTEARMDEARSEYDQ